MLQFTTEQSSQGVKGKNISICELKWYWQKTLKKKKKNDSFFLLESLLSNFFIVPIMLRFLYIFFFLIPQKKHFLGGGGGGGVKFLRFQLTFSRESLVPHQAIFNERYRILY